MMAIFDGISTGLNVLMNVIATLIVFLALVYLINSLLSIIPLGENVTLSLQLLLGTFGADYVGLRYSLGRGDHSGWSNGHKSCI